MPMESPINLNSLRDSISATSALDIRHGDERGHPAVRGIELGLIDLRRLERSFEHLQMLARQRHPARMPERSVIEYIL